MSEKIRNATTAEVKEWFEKELKPIGDKQMQYVAVMSVVQFMTFCFMLVSFWINSKIF
jgi:hypothetical protein